jgi:hypothetical protein
MSLEPGCPKYTQARRVLANRSFIDMLRFARRAKVELKSWPIHFYGTVSMLAFHWENDFA